MKYSVKFVVRNGFASVDVPKEIEPVNDLLTGDIQGGSPDPWLRRINSVLSGQSSYEEVTGNSCTAEIKPDFTKIFNNFTLEEVECLIETSELKQLIEMWVNERTKLYEEEERMRIANSAKD
jgi:hypothetical protein